MAEHHFPNGFDDWQETHYIIVEAIVRDEQREIGPCKKITETLEEFGTGGLWILAKNLTDQFEQENEGKSWGQDEDTDYHDTLDAFLNKNLFKE